MSKKEENQFELGRKLDDSIDGMTKKEISSHLENLAYAIEEGDYTKRLDDSEIMERKSRLADVNIQLSKLEDEKRDLMDEMKGRIDPVRKELKEVIEVVKSKSLNLTGRLFLFDDPAKGLMYKFDNTGVCVDLRPLTPQERQLKLRQEIKLNKVN